MNFDLRNWYTTGTIYLHQQQDNMIVGKFQVFLIVGKYFSSGDMIFHQYFPSGNSLTLWLRLDESHMNLDGYFWRNFKDWQTSKITLKRTPSLYQRALNYASSGDLDHLKELVHALTFHSKLLIFVR